MQRNCWSLAQYPRPNGYARMSGLGYVIQVFPAADGGLVLDSERTNADRVSGAVGLAVILIEVEMFQPE